jgi:hypothetical protein
VLTGSVSTPRGHRPRRLVELPVLTRDRLPACPVLIGAGLRVIALVASAVRLALVFRAIYPDSTTEPAQNA